MDAYWLFLFVPLLLLLIILFNRSIDASKDYDELLKEKIIKEGFTFLASKQPKIFDVGPFKKFEIKVGLFVNGRPSPSEHTSYRIVTFKTSKNKEEEVWAKIDTHTRKKTRIEFQPDLKTF